MLPKKDRELIMLAGRYMYYKMKDLGLPLTIESYNQYLDERAKEKRLKKKMGYSNFCQMKELGLDYEEYKQYQKEQKLKKYERKREKDKVRFKTIRYIERYCNLEMKCQICNTEEKIQIHHPNYNDYLKINILCKEHHNQLHRFELVPPQIIDLEKIAVKRPALKERQKYVQSQVDNIKEDVLKNGYTYKKLADKYQISSGTIKRYLEKDKDWEIIHKNLEEAKQRNIHMCKMKHQDNLIQKYRIEHNLSIEELSRITHIPIPTLRAIECGKTKIENITKKNKIKLQILNKTQLDTK